MQTMTGLRLDAYWVGNYLSDLIKFIPNVLTFIILQRIITGGDFNDSSWTIAAFAFCYIPYLYVMSFLFSNESAG